MSTTTTEPHGDDQQGTRLDVNALLRGSRQGDEAPSGGDGKQPSLNDLLRGARRQGR
jgi:hypothetical protein